MFLVLSPSRGRKREDPGNGVAPYPGLAMKTMIHKLQFARRQPRLLEASNPYKRQPNVKVVTTFIALLSRMESEYFRTKSIYYWVSLLYGRQYSELGLPVVVRISLKKKFQREYGKGVGFNLILKQFRFYQCFEIIKRKWHFKENFGRYELAMITKTSTVSFLDSIVALFFFFRFFFWGVYVFTKGHYNIYTIYIVND